MPGDTSTTTTTNSRARNFGPGAQTGTVNSGVGTVVFPGPGGTNTTTSPQPGGLSPNWLTPWYALINGYNDNTDPKFPTKGKLKKRIGKKRIGKKTVGKKRVMRKRSR